MDIVGRSRAALRILLMGDRQNRPRHRMPVISEEEIAEIKQFFPRDKFFIFGHARSGTTLLMRLLRLHPEVHCNYQAHFFTRKPLLKSLVNTPEAEEWLTRKSNRWNRGRDLSPLVLRAAADFIMERDAVRAGKRIVGDKSPTSNIHGQSVRDLHDVYPDAKLIYIVRDGRDVLISERFRNFVEESKYLSAEDRRILSGLREDRSRFTSDGRSIFTEAFMGRVVRGWVQNLGEVEGEGKRLFEGKFHSLRYEDILTNPYKELVQLWNFLEVENIDRSLEISIKEEMVANPDEEWQSRRNGDIASFLPKGQSGNWQKLFTDRDKVFFKAIGGEMLIKWKYENDIQW